VDEIMPEIQWPLPQMTKEQQILGTEDKEYKN
jgi:hypothetical protein